MPYRRLEDGACRRTGSAWGSACVWAAVLALPLCATRGADAPAGTTRYALTIANGKTRIVAAPPTTSENVLAVMQLLDGPADGTRLAALVSGKLAALATAEGPATVALTWDGKAWLPTGKVIGGLVMPAPPTATRMPPQSVALTWRLAVLSVMWSTSQLEGSAWPSCHMRIERVVGLVPVTRKRHQNHWFATHPLCEGVTNPEPMPVPLA